VSTIAGKTIKMVYFHQNIYLKHYKRARSIPFTVPTATSESIINAARQI